MLPTPGWSRDQVAVISEPMQVDITVQDLSQPKELTAPKYGGQVYIFVALFCGGVVIAGSFVLALLHTAVLWNLRVAQGDEVPWWACPAGRGW
jgi:hypothetical protein